MRIFGILLILMGLGAGVAFYLGAQEFDGVERFLRDETGPWLAFYAVVLFSLGLYAVVRKDRPAERPNRSATGAFMLGVTTFVVPGAFWLVLLDASDNCTGCRHLFAPYSIGALATLIVFVGPTAWLCHRSGNPEKAGESPRRADYRVFTAVSPSSLS